MLNSFEMNKTDYVLNIAFVGLLLLALLIGETVELYDLAAVIGSGSIVFYGIAGMIRKRIVFRLFAVDGAIAVIMSTILTILGLSVPIVWFF